MTLFTDWAGAHEPGYFWLRGAIWGVVMATLLWCKVVPWLKARSR